jgi:hypothetical protein
LRRKLKPRAVPYLVLPQTLRHSHLRQREKMGSAVLSCWRSPP